MRTLKRGITLLLVMLFAGSVFIVAANAEGTTQTDGTYYEYWGTKSYSAINSMHATPWTYGANVHIDVESNSYAFDTIHPYGSPYPITNIGVEMNYYAEQYPFNAGHIVPLHTEKKSCAGPSATIIKDLGGFGAAFIHLDTHHTYDGPGLTWQTDLSQTFYDYW